MIDYEIVLNESSSVMRRNANRMDEGVLTVVGGVILGIIGFKVLAGFVKGILGAAAAHCDEACDKLSIELAKQIREKLDTAFDAEAVKQLIIDHEKDFEGLSAYACAKVFEKLFAENFPEAYEAINSSTATQIYSKEKFKAPFKNQGRGNSDKDALERAKDKFGISF